jgi:hypothetical protein
MKKLLAICVVVASLCLAAPVNAQSYPPEISGDIFVGDFDGNLWIDVFSVGYSVPGIEGQLYQVVEVTHDEEGVPGDAIDIRLAGIWYSPFVGAPPHLHSHVGDSWTDEPATIPWDTDARAYLFLDLEKDTCNPDLWLPRLFRSAPGPARRLAAAHDALELAKTTDIETDYRFFAWTWNGTDGIWTRRHGYLTYTGSPPQWYGFAAVPYYEWTTVDPAEELRAELRSPPVVSR